MPQKPYNVLGSLKEQIMYPNTLSSTTHQIDDNQLLDILKAVRLETLAAKVGLGKGKIYFESCFKNTNIH